MLCDEHIASLEAVMTVAVVLTVLKVEWLSELYVQSRRVCRCGGSLMSWAVMSQVASSKL